MGVGAQLSFGGTSRTTVEGSGTLINDGELTLTNDTINAPLTNRNLLVAQANNSIIGSAPGAFANAKGATFRVEGTQSRSHADVTVTNGFTNDGTIELISTRTDFGLSASLTVTSGALVNQGLISVLQGPAGGGRTLAAELDNRGTVDIEKALSLGRSGAAHANSGSIRVNNGTTTVTGSFTQTTAGSLTFGIGGTVRGSEFGYAQISGAATLAGNLTIELTGGFLPSLGDSFEIMTFASLTGQFDTIDGLVLGNGLILTPVYSDTTLALVVVASP